MLLSSFYSLEFEALFLLHHLAFGWKEGLAVEKENAPLVSLAKFKQKKFCAHQSNSWYVKLYPNMEKGSSKCWQAAALST